MNYEQLNTTINLIAATPGDGQPECPRPENIHVDSLRESPTLNSRPDQAQRRSGNSTERRSRRPDIWSVASVAVLSFCLWMAWQPAGETSTREPLLPAAQSASVSWEQASRPIVDYRVGDVVLTDTARGDHDTSLGTQVDPQTWKHLVLKARKVDGSTADVEFLRPAWWLTERHAEVGGTVEVSVPECGIEGQATVLAINACPKLQPTPPGYRTVTGTFRHASADILDITVEGQSEPIGTTAVHPFWSEDRQAYVRADELKVGEHLLSDTGLVTITALAPRGSPEPVYNLEVLGDHNYKVTNASLLVHNGNGAWCPKTNRWRDPSTGRFTKAPGKGAHSPFTHIPTSGRKHNQLAQRGWDRSAIHSLVNKPHTTRSTINRSTGNRATAFFRADGHHVIRDDITGQLVQMSDTRKSIGFGPGQWAPDSEIVNAFIP